MPLRSTKIRGAKIALSYHVTPLSENRGFAPGMWPSLLTLSLVAGVACPLLHERFELDTDALAEGTPFIDAASRDR